VRGFFTRGRANEAGVREFRTNLTLIALRRPPCCVVPVPISDYAPAEGSSFFFDYSSYLDILFDADAAKARFELDYCDDRGTGGHRETCAEVVSAALEAAVATVKNDQGDDMSGWSKKAENIVLDALGAGSVDEIPWQNRGTHNHVVEILSPASG
jgi:hypothetical protein